MAVFCLLLSAAFGRGDADGAVIDRIIAIVNDEIITQSDIQKKLQPTVNRLRQKYQGKELYERIALARKNIIDRLISDALVYDWAKKNDVKVDENIVEARLDQLKKSLPSNSEFERMLIEENITLKQLKDQFREQLMVKKAVEVAVLQMIIVSPNEVAHYYNDHLKDFSIDKAHKLSNILFKFTSEEGGKELAHKRAGEALAKIMAGTDFAEVAKEYSDGLNKHRGGDMGYVTRGELLDSIEAIIEKLPEGGLSPIIETDIGLHIFRVEEIRVADIAPLEKVSAKIQDIIYRKKAKENIDRWVNQLKEDAYISIK